MIPLRRFARRPGLHFIVLGGLLFLAQQAGLLPESRDRIRVSAEQIGQLRADWLRETGRLPRPAEMNASLRRHLDEEILLREALREGLDTADAVARERLLQNMRFAFPQADETDDALLEQARALGMPQRDLVVRRRLVQLMEHRLVSRTQIGEKGLREYRTAHAKRYAAPERIAFKHLFFSRDSGQAQLRATRALAQLRSSNTEPAGDAFLLGNHWPAATAGEIERIFGERFARAVLEAPVQQWNGPLESPYGVHLVRVLGRQPAGTDGAADARAAYAYLHEEEQRTLRKELAALRGRYEWESVP